MKNDRLAALLHYIIESVPGAELGAVKLNKIAWFADRDAFALLGRSISGREYIKLQYGPVPRGVLNEIEHLKNTGCIVEKKVTVVDFSRREYESIQRSDFSLFSHDELSIVDQVIAFSRNKSAAELSDISHDEVWQSHELGEVISMQHAAAAAFMKPVDEKALEWVRRIEGHQKEGA